MDLTSNTVWFTIALCFITAVVTMIVRGRIKSDPMCKGPLPPAVNTSALLGLVPTLFRKGPLDTINDLYAKFGSVFTISLFGVKVTFLVGGEVSTHFYRGLESEISPGNMLEFTVPMFGQEVGYGVDSATRNEQMRFYSDALKPSKLRSHVDPMVQEVEVFFAKWGQDGIVDIKHELDQLLMLIASRCLLGKEVREKMFDEVSALFRGIDTCTHLISIFFPYIPTPANLRRDKARVKLTEKFSEIVRSRRSSNRVEEDALQILLDSKYKDGHSTTETEVAGLIIGLIFAGKHTSTHTSTYTGACLLSHEKFLTAAIEEQKQIIRKYNDRIDYNVLLEMDILHSCIKEALRMHPPTPMLLRKAHKLFTVRTKEGNEFDIPKEHIVASPIVLNNNISYIYKDPHVYDPDRFGPGRVEDKVGGKFSYTSFGGGRHACIGEAYAYMQIKVIWSHLLRNFELKLLSPFPKTDWCTLASEPQGKVMVSYKRHRLPST